MKNTAFGALIASSLNCCSSVSAFPFDNSRSGYLHGIGSAGPHPAEAALVRSITTCREDYFFTINLSGDVRHTLFVRDIPADFRVTE
jgi:hypothetical protein